MTRRPERTAVVLRGAAAAGVATFAAAVGHAIGQQSPPSAWVVVLAVALALPVCVALAGRRLSVPRLAVAVALSQLGFHLLLRLDFVGASVVTPGHHGAMSATMPAMSGAAGAPPHDTTPAMWAGHALAAVATIVVLAVGERALVALVALARRPFRALAAVAAPGVAGRAPVAAALGIRPTVLRAGAVRRRGPPALV